MLQINEKSIETCISRQMNNLRVIYKPDAHSLGLSVIRAIAGIRRSLSVDIEVKNWISSLLTVQSFPAALSRIKLFVQREAILAISSTTCHKGN